jgi:hypothetical protein
MPGLNEFTNNASTTLASNVLVGDTSLTVATGYGSIFPTLTGSEYFYCTLTNAAATIVEIVKVTARVSDTFTIVRAQEGTSAQAWSTGDKVELRLTAASLQNFPQLDSTNTFAQAQTFSAGLTSTATPIGVASGGTGLGTLTANNVIIGNGASSPTFVAPGSNGNVLSSNGTTWVSTAPASGSRSGATSTTFSTGSTLLTLTSASSQLQIIQGSVAGVIKLPDATTMTKGADYFAFYNASAFPVTVQDYNGVTREFLPVSNFSNGFAPGAISRLNLVDNSTAAGIWRIGYPVVAGNFSSTSLMTGTFDTTKYNSGNYANLKYYRVGPTSGVALYRDSATNRSLYARCFSINTSTGAITYSSAQTLLFTHSATTGFSYIDYFFTSNGTDRGVVFVGGFSGGTNNTASNGCFVALAVVSNEVYASSTITFANVQSSNGWGGGGGGSSYYGATYYAGADDCFFGHADGYAVWAYASPGNATTGRHYVYGLNVGVSGTTVTLTQATGNTDWYVNDSVIEYYASSSDFALINGGYDSTKTPATYNRYWSYNTSTNTITYGARTNTATLLSGQLPYMGYGALSINSGANITASGIVYAISNAGTANLSGTANQYGFKFKGVEQSAYTTNSASITQKPDGVTAFYKASSTSLKILHAGYIYDYDPANATMNSSRAAVASTGSYWIMDSDYIFAYSGTAFGVFSLATPFIS